jgi:hypothetical protein
MQPPKILQTRRAIHGTRLGSLVFALLLIATLTVPGVRAADLRPEASVTPQVPPAYPDRTHVTNGCHISTITFLDRFLAEFPDEQGEPLVITMLNADGVRRSHTIALISWQGQWWCRDESFGVFALGCPVEAQPDRRRLNTKAETMLEKHAKMLIRAAMATPQPAPPTEMSSEQRIREVAVAARMIPFPTTIFWVKCGSRELPVAFFRPTARQIAVYEPLHGTCLAECSSRDDAKVVSLVASRLGYHVDAIHAEHTSPRGTLVASADLPHAVSQ